MDRLSCTAYNCGNHNYLHQLFPSPIFPLLFLTESLFRLYYICSIYYLLLHDFEITVVNR